MQCIINLCSKTNDIYARCMHFGGHSFPKKLLHSQKTYAVQGEPRTGPFPKKPSHALGFWLRVWALELHFTFPDLNFWLYAYVKVSDNKIK